MTQGSLHSVPGFGPFHLHDEIVVAMSIETVNGSLCIFSAVVGDESKALGLEGVHVLCKEDTLKPATLSKQVLQIAFLDVIGQVKTLSVASCWP